MLFRPANSTELPKNRYKTSLQGNQPLSYSRTYLPALLAGMVTIGGTALYNRYQKQKDFEAQVQPLGVLNLHGICYLAGCIQIFEAVRHALGEKFTRVITSGNDIIGAYATVRSDIESMRYYKDSKALVMDPQPIVEAWVAAYPKFYHQHQITQCIAQGDGSEKRTVLCPYRLDTKGAKGFPDLAMGYMLDVYAQRCEQAESENPFACQFKEKSGPFTSSHYISYKPTGGTDIIPAAFDPAKTLHSRLVSAPSILMLQQEEREPHDLPLYFTVSTPNDDHSHMVHTYHLLAAAYGIPIIDPVEGFMGGHCMAIVRYGSLWYECDNHRVVPLRTDTDAAGTLASATAWIQKAARTSYNAQHMKGSPYLQHVPVVICYEKISEHRKQGKQRKQPHSIRMCGR